MKIELEYPFVNDWRLGYLRTSRDGRKRVDLYNSDTDRTTISYSRYLMSCHIGRYLNEDEEVDHIDRNKANDDISNLQILSIEDHRKKSTLEATTGRTMVSVTCSYCGRSFEKEKRNVKYANSFCNRSCAGKYNGFKSIGA